jgi:2,3-bisphosphoglycerate-dependent phosphoglycerate mutase
MPATSLCLIRHGETDWNAAKRMQGQLDLPLNARGCAQAQATASALRKHRFDHVYSSDLLRALQTAGPATDLLGLPIQRSPALRERHYGALQGKTYAEFELQHPHADAPRLRLDLDHVIPGGSESLRGFATRVTRALTEIAQRHRGETVLVFTHGGVLDIAYRLASDRPIEAQRDFPLLNGALNWITYKAGRWALVRWAHLVNPGARLHLDEAHAGAGAGEGEGAAQSLPVRKAARLLLINHRGEVLLYSYSTKISPPLAAQGHEHFWLSPGGGVEPGETFKEAALRELAEETGLTGVDIGESIALRECPVDRGGHWNYVTEHYFALEVGDFTPDTSGFTAFENTVINAYRWWSADEIEASDAAIYPENLAGLLRRLAAR